MMWVERGRGALVAVAELGAAAGDVAAQAFERLGAEVTILRRAMENLAAAVVETRPVDPTPTLEALGARLERVEARLRSVEEQPALKQTAEKQGAAGWKGSWKQACARRCRRWRPQRAALQAWCNRPGSSLLGCCGGRSQQRLWACCCSGWWQARF
jgi:hypothetical protein